MKRGVFTLVASVIFIAPAAADEVDASKKAHPALEPIVELRLRSESVNQAGISSEARATTLRGRLGFETAEFSQTQLLAEAELAWPWQTDYNSTVNGKTAYPIVADPESHELNRLQLLNTSLPDTTVIVGRQRINLDDQRFIGNVGWRQNEQTFDALRLINKSLAQLTVDLAYVDQVNRVFGKDSPAGRYHGDTYLLNLSYPTPLGTLTGFAYLLDLDEAPLESSETFGLRLSGHRTARRVIWGYSAAYARQQQRADNPLSYDAGYSALELSGAWHETTLSAGIEVLEGDGVKGFSTPFATLHKFQGWADKFLTTPPNGIDDRYLAVAFSRKGLSVLDALTMSASYHRYESQRLAIDYGSEVNLQVQAQCKHFTGLIKYAHYDADGFATDTGKFWAQVEYVW